VKEFLSARAVEFVSINVLEDREARERLARGGIRTLPVVSRDDAFVPGMDLARVAEFLGLDYQGGNILPADVLVSRYHRVLDAAVRYVGQIPPARLHDTLPHRDRSYLALGNHLVQIAVDFLSVTRGAALTGRLAESVPETELEPPALMAAAAQAKRGLADWLAAADSAELASPVVTYFGSQTLHQVLERAVWHSAQHGRQLMMVLQRLGISPDGPLTDEDFAGLPMPEEVWDG
jgi:hypothetical protein